jgi:Fe-S oxidoreductase
VKLKEADRQDLQLISVLKNLEPKQVLVYCPACLYTIKKELTKIIDIPFQVIDLLELVGEALGIKYED